MSACTRLRGFTLVEVVVVLCLVGLLGGLAANRLFYYQEAAEKAAMDYDLEAFRMGLRIRVAQLMAANDGAGRQALERESPVRWLEKPPVAYAGEYPAKGEPPPGHWYYASQENQLIYVPRNAKHLETTSKYNELRFKVTANAGIDIAVVPVTSYKWF